MPKKNVCVIRYRYDGSWGSDRSFPLTWPFTRSTMNKNTQTSIGRCTPWSCKPRCSVSLKSKSFYYSFYAMNLCEQHLRQHLTPNWKNRPQRAQTIGPNVLYSTSCWDVHPQLLFPLGDPSTQISHLNRVI